MFLREPITPGFYRVIVFSCKGWCGFCRNILSAAKKNVTTNHFTTMNSNKILRLLLCKENLCLYLDSTKIITDIYVTNKYVYMLPRSIKADNVIILKIKRLYCIIECALYSYTWRNLKRNWHVHSKYRNNHVLFV